MEKDLSKESIMDREFIFDSWYWSVMIHYALILLATQLVLKSSFLKPIEQRQIACAFAKAKSFERIFQIEVFQN